MMQKPRIVIISDTLKGHGGEETVLQLFSQYLSDSYTLGLVVPEFLGNQQWFDTFKKRGNRVDYRCTHSKLLKLFYIVNVLRKVDTDILITMTPEFTYLANKCRRFFNKKYQIVSWQHFAIFSSDEMKNLKWKRKMYQSADYFFAISSGIRNDLVSLGITPTKIHIVYNPVVSSKNDISSIRRNEIHFLCISRIQFSGQKNLSELFAACANLKGKWFLDIYGADDTEGQVELAKCQNYANTLGIADHIIWHGWVDDVWKEDLSADCLVLTSNYEGFPMSLCEAASHGIPIISSDCPTGPSDIVNSENGFLYKMHNVSELSQFMQMFIDNEVHFDKLSIKNSISKYSVPNYMNVVKSAISDILPHVR